MANKNLFAGSRLPPGFRFHPTDVELVMYYLKRKVSGKKILQPLAISEVDIYKYAPWELQHKSCWHGRDLKWYFFCPAEKKYANGGRMRRSTDLGYWKTTGKDREVQYNKEVVGMIKTLVFHRGKAPKGTRTDWVMYEYRLEHKKLADEGVVQDSYVLCILFEKEGPGPKNGAQYGAPFREEDWENDDDDDDDGGGEEVMVEKLNGGEVVSLVDVSAPSVAPVSPDVTASTVVPVSPVVTDMPPSICTAVLASCPLENLPSADVLVPDVSNFDDAFFEALGESSDELDVLLASFSNEHPFNVDEARNFGSADMFDNGGIVEADQNIESVDFQQASVDGDAVDGDNIFNGLGELNYLRDYNYYGDFLEMLDMSDPMDFQADPPTGSVLGEQK